MVWQLTSNYHPTKPQNHYPNVSTATAINACFLLLLSLCARKVFFLWGDWYSSPSVKAKGRGRSDRRDEVQQLCGPEQQLGQRRRQQQQQRAKEKEEKEARFFAAAEVMIYKFQHFSWRVFWKYTSLHELPRPLTSAAKAQKGEKGFGVKGLKLRIK